MDIVTDGWPSSPCRILHDGASGTRRFQMSCPHGRYFEDLPSLPDVREDMPDMHPFLLDEPMRPPPSPRYFASDNPSGVDEDAVDPDNASAGASPSCSPSHATASRSQATVFGGGVSKPTKATNSRKQRKAQHRGCSVYVGIRPHDDHLALLPNRDKWAPPQSDLMPPMCPEWRAALPAVNRSAQRRTSVHKARAGLMYPDPAYLVSVAHVNRALVVAAWLSIRPACCGQMLYPTISMMPVIPAAVWRQFFWIYRRQPVVTGVLAASTADTGDPAVDCKLDAATEAAKAMFGPELVNTMNKTSREVFWRATAYDVVEGRVVNMGHKAIREIVWELAELNWRYELLTLDKFAAPHMWLDSDGAFSRVSTILLVSGHSSSFILTNALFPACNFSVSADSRAGRLKAFTALRRIMADWQGCPAAIKEAISDYVPSSSECPEARVVEAQTMLFYCQSFFDYFRSPPVLPCRLHT